MEFSVRFFPYLLDWYYFFFFLSIRNATIIKTDSDCRRSFLLLFDFLFGYNWGKITLYVLYTFLRDTFLYAYVFMDIIRMFLYTLKNRENNDTGFRWEFYLRILSKFYSAFFLLSSSLLRIFLFILFMSLFVIVTHWNNHHVAVYFTEGDEAFQCFSGMDFSSP